MNAGNPGLIATWQVNRAKAVQFIIRTFNANGGNISKTAKALNVNRRSIHRWIKEDATLRKGLGI